MICHLLIPDGELSPKVLIGKSRLRSEINEGKNYELPADDHNNLDYDDHDFDDYYDNEYDDDLDDNRSKFIRDGGSDE